MKYFKTFFLFCLLQSISAYLCLLAESNPSPIPLKNKITERFESSFFEDKTGQSLLRDITSDIIQNKFIDSDTNSYSFGFSKSHIWLKLRLKDNLNQLNKWFLELDNPMLRLAKLHYKNAEGKWVNETNGLDLKFSERPIHHRNISFYLPIANMSGEEFYLDIHSDRSINFDVNVRTEHEIIAQEHDDLLWFGIYYGAIFMLAMYNLLFFFSMKDKVYLYLFAYIFNIGLMLSSFHGWAFMFFWPESPSLNDLIMAASVFLTILSLNEFGRNFLETKTNAPRWDIVLKTYSCLILIFMASSWMVDFNSSLMIFSILILPFFPILFTTAIICLYKGFLPAKHFISPIFLLLSYGTVFTLSRLGVIQFKSDHIAEILMIIHLILFSYALLYKLNIFRKSLELAQTGVIQEKQNFLDVVSVFVPKELLNLMGNKNIYDINVGSYCKKTVTLLFLDIRDFTAISDRISPQKNFDFINSFHKYIEPVIRKNDGVVENYIGDAIMAIFPRRPEDAIVASIMINSALKVFNNEYREIIEVDVEIGIGIHTGEVIIGIIGSDNKISCSAISHNINTVMEIEKLNKKFNSKILISEETLKNCTELNFNTRSIAQMNTGKDQSMKITELLDIYDGTQVQLRKQSYEMLKIGLTFFTRKDYQNAKLHLAKILELNPSDNVVKYYLYMCDVLLKAITQK